MELVVDGRVSAKCVEEAIDQVPEISRKGGAASLEYKHKINGRDGFINLGRKNSEMLVTIGWGELGKPLSRAKRPVFAKFRES